MNTRARLVVAAIAGALLLGLASPVQAADPPLCDGVLATIWGTPGPDHLIGTPGPDVISGLGSDDIIEGNGGDDLLCGDGGDDTVLAGAGDDVVLGGRGDDVLRGSRGNDILYGGEGDDDLRGQGEDDRALGGSGDDFLSGGPGDDVLKGLAGDDVLLGGNGSDALDGGVDADRLAGNAGTDFLQGGGLNDRLRGGGGSDVVDGGSGKNLGSGDTGTDFCTRLAKPRNCEVIDPGLWDWLRTPQAEALADRLQALVVLQTGCVSALDLDWAAVAAGVFGGSSGEALTDAVDDLAESGRACNVDPDAWRGALRDALVHLETFNASILGGRPEPVGALATPAQIAPAAADIAQATFGHLVGGFPPQAETDFWWRLVHSGHARQLALAATGYDVLLMGSSTMVSAGVPSAFTTLDGRSAYNAALPGSRPNLQALWLADEAVALADPELVIIGVEDRAFRTLSVEPGTCLEPVDDWADARSMRERVFEPVEALAASSESALFFGDPALAAPTRPLAAHDYFAANHGPLGNRDDFPPNLTVEQKQVSLGAILPWSVGFEACDEQLGALGGMVSSLRALGIDVLVVAMPTSDLRAGAFDPLGGGDVDAGRAVIDGLMADVAVVVAGAGGAFADLSDHSLLPEERFRDTAHLDEVGATIFTTLLAAVVAALP